MLSRLSQSLRSDAFLVCGNKAFQEFPESTHGVRVMQQTLIEPVRTATNGLEMRNVDGVRIGTAVIWFLEQLNAQGDG
jgi:hypothetical protein